MKEWKIFLSLYEKPWDPKEPVICLDEKCLQILEDLRPAKSARPGRAGKQDSEYVRRGTGNVFCGVEPQAGRHLTWVTENRKADTFAKITGRIARAYPGLKMRHLVMDNLNTHKEKSLTDYYGPIKGRKLWKSFTVHYTPRSMAVGSIRLRSRLAYCRGNVWGKTGLLASRDGSTLGIGRPTESG